MRHRAAATFVAGVSKHRLRPPRPGRRRSNPTAVPAPEDPVQSDHRGQQPQAGPPAQLPRGGVPLGAAGRPVHPRRHSPAHPRHPLYRALERAFVVGPLHLLLALEHLANGAALDEDTIKRLTADSLFSRDDVELVFGRYARSICTGGRRCLTAATSAGRSDFESRDLSLPVRRESLRRGRLHVRGAGRGCLTLFRRTKRSCCHARLP